MEAVDTRYVKFGPDVGQLQKGGSDPVKVVKDFLSVVRHVHLKDWDGGAHYEGYCPLGQGKVDVAGIVDLLDGSGNDLMIMAELDPTANMPLAPLEAARINKADAAEARLRLPLVEIGGGHSETQRQSGADHGSEPRHRARHRGSVRRRRRGCRGELRRQHQGRRRGRGIREGQGPPRDRRASRRREARRSRADDRARVERARADRHPREQRGHRDDRAVPRADRRSVDAARRRQPARARGSARRSTAAAPLPKAAKGTSSTSDRSRRRRCCRDARTTRPRSSGSKR